MKRIRIKIKNCNTCIFKRDGHFYVSCTCPVKKDWKALECDNYDCSPPAGKTCPLEKEKVVYEYYK